MKQKQHMTAFYMETILLMIVFLMVILLLTRVFSYGKVQSKQARDLTNAVCLAQSAAEAAASSEDVETLYQMMDQGNAEREGNQIQAWYDADMNPQKNGYYRLVASWESEEGTYGSFVNGIIHVYINEEEIYRLDTGVYLQEAGS